MLNLNDAKQENLQRIRDKGSIDIYLLPSCMNFSYQ